MKTSIESLGKVGRSLTVARKKEKGAEQLRAELKFDGLEVQRETIEALVATKAKRIFDELGVPFAGVEISLVNKCFVVTGTIGRPEDPPVLKLVQAELSGVTIRLRENGGMMAGVLNWKARGDEAEDVETLLAHEVRVKWDVRDSGQQELALTPGTKSIVDGQQAKDVVADALAKASRRKAPKKTGGDFSPGASHD